jgi:hypothetical protein
MKTAIKFLAVLFAVFCFVFACEVTQQDRKPLTSADEMFNLRDTLPAGGVMPQALKVVGGRDWINWFTGDSITAFGFALLSQDTNGLRERVVTDEAVLSWLIGILPDSLSLSGYTDTLTITAIGDSIAIQGSNSLQMPFRLYGVDTLSDIYTKTFPSGSRIINRANGAQYLVQADSVSGYTTDSVAVIPTGGRYAVLQPQQGQYDVTHFGAVGDGITNNGDIPAKAATYISGNAILNMPKGKFIFDQTIEVSNNGLKIKGAGAANGTDYGTVLIFRGTGSAINAGSISFGDTRSNRINLEGFALIGTDSAEHGIKLDLINATGSLQNDRISNLRIEDFTQTGSYAIYFTRTYNILVDRCRISNNDNGIYYGTEAVNIAVENTWIRNALTYGLHCTYGGQNSFSNGIIDYSGTPASTQRGVYNTGELNLNNVHFENNYVHVEATSAGRMVIHQSKFNAVDSINAIFADGARIRLIGNRLPANAGISAGLGTEWIGGIEGNYAAPTITTDNPTGFATITNVTGSFTLTTYQINAIPGGPFTLLFLNDSVTIDHTESGQKILLKNKLPFKGYAGDRLTLQKQENIGGTVTLIEVGRTRYNPVIHLSTARTLSRGDHELTFTNKYATDTITITLPNPGAQRENHRYSFIKLAAQELRILPGSSRRIEGANSAATWVSLRDVGSSMTLRCDSLRWYIEASNGVYTYENPATGYTGGNISGTSLDRIGDSLGLIAYTADRLLYGSGSTTLGNNSAFTYNGSAGANTRYIDINNGDFGRIRFGLSDAANRPSISGYKDETSATTEPALAFVGQKHEGTFSSPTDFTEAQAQLLSITGKAYRGSGYRNAAGITIGGDNLMSGAGYSGYIGFATATTTTYVRRATIHRNGDFYIGDGLPTNDLASPSAKIYIRSNSTTGSEYAMLVENSAETDLFSIRNGGEVNVGNLTDIGAYIMQITGDTYMDGSLTVTDSIILNGLSIISGTTAPDAGLGSQGSLYMRDDDDSTLYTKTGTGWVLLN